MTAGQPHSEPLNEQWARDYLGWKELCIEYLYEELQPGIDPLSGENKLILLTGPISGTFVPNSDKLAIAAKSPASNTILAYSI